MHTITLEKGLGDIPQCAIRQKQKRGDYPGVPDGYLSVYLVSPCQ
jgi:hypothetical protein